MKLIIVIGKIVFLMNVIALKKNGILNLNNKLMRLIQKKV